MEGGLTVKRAKGPGSNCLGYLCMNPLPRQTNVTGLSKGALILRPGKYMLGGSYD